MLNDKGCSFNGQKAQKMSKRKTDNTKGERR